MKSKRRVEKNWIGTFTLSFRCGGLDDLLSRKTLWLSFIQSLCVISGSNNCWTCRREERATRRKASVNALWWWCDNGIDLVCLPVFFYSFCQSLADQFSKANRHPTRNDQRHATADHLIKLTHTHISIIQEKMRFVLKWRSIRKTNKFWLKWICF